MFKQIELKYDFDDFKDTLSSKNLEAHYNVLYKGYVDNYNKALEMLSDARRENNFTNIKALEKNLAFQGAGAVLHSLFFENISPYPTSISGKLLEKLNNDFENYDTFVNQFINAMSNIEGGGWGILGYSSSIDKLIILTAEKHQDLTIWDFKPLLVIDMWEHAYYLDYVTNKKEYATKIMKLIDWNVVEKRYRNI